MPSPRLITRPPCAQDCRNGPLARPGANRRSRPASCPGRRPDSRCPPTRCVDVADRGRTQVRVRAAGDARRLQPPARLVAAGAHARAFGNESVEAGVPGLVLGEVRDARRRVDGDRLVQHAAHADDRLARSSPRRPRALRTRSRAAGRRARSGRSRSPRSSASCPRASRRPRSCRSSRQARAARPPIAGRGS